MTLQNKLYYSFDVCKYSMNNQISNHIQRIIKIILWELTPLLVLLYSSGTADSFGLVGARVLHFRASRQPRKRVYSNYFLSVFDPIFFKIRCDCKLIVAQLTV